MRKSLCVAVVVVVSALSTGCPEAPQPFGSCVDTCVDSSPDATGGQDAQGEPTPDQSSSSTPN